MNFSEALEALKNGTEVQREGWNGKGLFVAAQFPDENSKMGNPYLYIDATALGGECNPWVPSQTDIFASDWITVDHTATEPQSAQAFQDAGKAGTLPIEDRTDKDENTTTSEQ